jgi:hypothetical protein
MKRQEINHDICLHLMNFPILLDLCTSLFGALDLMMMGGEGWLGSEGGNEVDFTV